MAIEHYIAYQYAKNMVIILLYLSNNNPSHSRKKYIYTYAHIASLHQ